jgi:hypothetical protein
MTKREVQTKILQTVYNELSSICENQQDLQLVIAIKILTESVRKGNSQDVIDNFSNLVTREVTLALQKMQETDSEDNPQDGFPLFM